MNFLLTILALALSFSAWADFTGDVVGVADGDTITVLDTDKVQHKIRLKKRGRESLIDKPHRVNRAETLPELESLRRSVQRGQPFGGESWQARTAACLPLEWTLRPRGRPRKKDGER